MENTYSILYKFQVAEGREEEFEKAWRELTQLIYDHAGSLGSRLHKEPNGPYIAYALWPDKETWEHSESSMPSQADMIRLTMRSICESIDVMHQMDVVADYLTDKQKGAE